MTDTPNTWFETILKAVIIIRHMQLAATRSLGLDSVAMTLTMTATLNLIYQSVVSVSTDLRVSLTFYFKL